VFDHFKPGIPEFAGLLPPALARALEGWDARRQRRGRPPFSLALKIGTHTVWGALALALLSAATPLRRGGQRFRQEQTLIEQWLQGVVQGSAAAWQVGHELALCGRLIKGYGSTNERGKQALLHVLEQLTDKTAFATPAARAQAMSEARHAALADDGGRALDATLLRHGAAPRPLKAQPIRFVRRATAPK
jgi:indolepyruvate ferredoxin oxidoreductase, beta subunit